MPIKSLSAAISAVIALTSINSQANAQAVADVIGVSIASPQATGQSLPIVEHTTGKGKVIRGVIRTDLSHAQAKEIDPYTFRKDNGYFIREKYLSEMGDVAVTPESSSVEEGVQKAQEQTEEQKQVIAQEQAVAKQEQARARAADRLRGVADKMLADAESELGRERLTNTHKRAREAASSIADATRASGIAKTMGNLADAIASGHADKLAGLTSRTQVELLDSMLRSAQYQRWMAEGKNHSEKERLKGSPLTEQDVAYTKMPEVFMHRGHGRDIAAALAGKKGYVKASAWAYSKIGSAWSDDNVYTLSPSEYDMAKTVIKGMDSIGKKQTVLQLVEGMAKIDRLSRMGIKNKNDLHAALKEYLQFRDGGIKEDPVKAAERKLVGQKVGIDFFPTPKSLAQRMVELAGIEQGDRVLEPSAGSGNIADAAKAAGAKVDTIEVSYELRALLGLKGHTVIGNDFEMEDYSGRYYDAVLMNPPFSDRKDALHIMRAFDLLKKGGTLVAIAGEGVFFGSDAKAVGFRDWLKEHKAHIEKLPEGTFMDKTLLATTGANARLIVMTRRTATGDVTSDDHLQDAGGAVVAADAQADEPVTDAVADPVSPDAFALAAQTEEDLRQKEAADKAALAKEEQERIAAERKAKADREAADFRLSGSDRPADVAIAAGQTDLFAPKTRGQKEADKNLPKSEATISDADYAQVVEAAKYLKDIVYSLDNLIGDDKRLLLSLSSPLGKSGRDTILMDAFGIARDLAHTIHNRMDDRKPHKLRDIDMTDAFDTFPMLKKIIDDAKEELRLLDERKAAKDAKNATLTDDMDPNSPNYRYRDTGYVAATRKEQAQSQIRIARDSGQQVTLQMIDWEAIEENPRVAKELIIKSNLFGKVDWDALKSAGMTPEAGFLIDRVYASIAPEPEGEGTQTRRNYALALQSLRDRLESCKTAQQVTDVLEEVREELTGFQLSSDEEAEYTALQAQSSAVFKEEMALEDQSKGPYSKSQDSYYALRELEREADKRARRGWKPEPGSAEKIAAAKKQHDDDERAWRDILNANKPRIEEIRQQRTAISKQMRTIKENAQRRNLTESPATLGWITFGKRFFSLLHWRRSSGSDTFAGHVVNARAGRIGGWEWAEKERATKTVKEPTKKEVRFHLKVTEQFDRKGGKPVSVASTTDLQKAFGLRHIVSGNWVLKDPLSAKFHVENAAGAFMDMGDMLGIDPAVLGLGGRLALGFGAFGKGNAGFGGAAAAHYDPTNRVINLTKMKGGGSLGHEYFHALDNLIHEMVNGKVSEKGDQFVSITPELVPAGPLRDAFAELRVAMLTGTVRLNESITLKPNDKRLAAHNIDTPRASPIAQAIKDAGGIEAAVMAVKSKLIPTDKRREKIRNDWIRIAVAYYSPEGTTEVMVPTGPKVSSFKAEAVILDQGVTDKYWSQSNEMASRAFQAYLEDRLAAADRQNDYLSAYADNKHYVNPFEGDKKPFPEGEERKRINAAFDKMFEVIRSQQILEKAAANKPLMDAMFPDFDPESEMTEILSRLVA